MTAKSRSVLDENNSVRTKQFAVAAIPAGLWIFLTVYSICLFLLLPRLSLLFDEILDILTVHAHTWSGLIAAVPQNSGGVPISYFVRWLTIHWLGESSFSARLPSALFSLVACPGVFFLARCFGLRWPLLAVTFFAAFPLSFRYALEARAYSAALCFSVWATVLFLRWLDHPAASGRALLYGLCVTAGLYTHPYSFLIPLVHLAWLWLAANNMESQTNRMRISATLILIFAILLFVPWYLYGSRIWGHQVTTSGINWRSGLLILHELSGAGYFGTIVLLSAVAFGISSNIINKRNQRFWLFYLLVPIAGALAADLLFTYFFAIRQLIFILPPLAILSAAGVESVSGTRPVAGALLLAALLITMLYGDIHLFRRPRENWQAAARILTQNADNGCVIFAPESSAALYTYFNPPLAFKKCSVNNLAAVDSVAIAVSSYGDTATTKNYIACRSQLLASSWIQVANLNTAGPRIELYRRESTSRK